MWDWNNPEISRIHYFYLIFLSSYQCQEEDQEEVQGHHHQGQPPPLQDHKQTQAFPHKWPPNHNQAECSVELEALSWPVWLLELDLKLLTRQFEAWWEDHLRAITTSKSPNSPNKTPNSIKTHARWKSQTLAAVYSQTMTSHIAKATQTCWSNAKKITTCFEWFDTETTLLFRKFKPYRSIY